MNDVLDVLRVPLALALLLGIPTLVLHRRAGLPADSGTARLLHAFGLSLLGLILGGLLLNTVLPVVGVDRPLAPVPLTIAWVLVDVALLAWRRDVPLLPGITVRSAARSVLDARWELAQALAALTAVLAILGAVRLNNGAGGGVAQAAQVVAACALLALVLLPDGGLGRDARTIALVGAGFLLATSLRGWHITGHDIQAEFLAFRLTNGTQHWDMGSLPNAYNACLSVNILPTVLAQTTGLSGEHVFKVLLQLVFALVPVLTYLFARRFVTRRLALAGAVFTMAFPTFFTDMPYLVRQEIAFFFLALLLLAATEPDRTPRVTRPLVVVLGIGVVLSHYSTTYVLLMALAGALLALAVAPVVRRVARRPADVDRTPLVLLNPLVVAVLVGATLAWAGPITHTGGHASSVVTQTLDALRGKGSEGPSSSDTSYSIFNREQTSPRERMDLFVQATLDYRDAEIPADERVVPDPGPTELKPRLLPATTAPLTAVGRGLDAVGLDPVHVDKALKLGCALVLQVFALVGVGWLLLRRRRAAGPHPHAADVTPEESSGPSREVGFLSLGAMAALALVVLIPNLSVDYGVLRAFQQTLLVIAPVMAMGMWVVLRPLARSRTLTAVALVPVALLVVLTGVLPAVLGGQQERIALANSGTYYDRFFASDSETEATTWLTTVDEADPTNDRTIASRNDNVRLLAASDNTAAVSDRLYPTLLTEGSYVFVDGQIVDQGVSTIFYTGDLLTYAYPIRDLDRHLDLVYSAPQARIYR